MNQETTLRSSLRPDLASFTSVLDCCTECTEGTPPQDAGGALRRCSKLALNGWLGVHEGYSRPRKERKEVMAGKDRQLLLLQGGMRGTWEVGFSIGDN